MLSALESNATLGFKDGIVESDAKVTVDSIRKTGLCAWLLRPLKVCAVMTTLHSVHTRLIIRRANLVADMWLKCVFMGGVSRLAC